MFSTFLNSSLGEAPIERRVLTYFRDMGSLIASSSGVPSREGQFKSMFGICKAIGTNA
jgi:hypothetical protein